MSTIAAKPRETRLTWLRGPETIPYVRVGWPTKKHRSRHGSPVNRQDLLKNEGRLVVGWAETDAPTDNRRYFYLTAWDRALDAKGPYRRDEPVGAIDPGTLAPNKPGEHPRGATPAGPQ
jgi:hypothetical protein